MKKVFISSKDFALSACPPLAGYFDPEFLRRRNFLIYKKKNLS